MERVIPPQWDSLPDWVKDELQHGSRDLLFYNWHITRLVTHSENMKAVWRLFDQHRESFAPKGPVLSLLEMLHFSFLGPDPGRSRTDADRKVISAAISKHVAGLTKQIDRLAAGSPFGVYPFWIACLVDGVAWKKVEKMVTEPFRETAQQIEAELNRVGVAVDVLDTVGIRLESLQFEMEREAMELFADPRASMEAIAESAKEWAEDCGWGRDDIIWEIGNHVIEWFGHNHFAVTATLTTAITSQEVTEDVVAGVIKRGRSARALQKSQGRERRKFSKY